MADKVVHLALPYALNHHVELMACLHACTLAWPRTAVAALTWHVLAHSKQPVRVKGPLQPQLLAYEGAALHS